MAWRIDDLVERGQIDNRVKGRVCGEIWLAQREHPLRLELTGNCLGDLAGCLLRFENPAPLPDSAVADALDTLQTGGVGDMTASRKVRVLEVRIEEAMFLAEAGLPIPEHMGNCLYLEWISDSNGRVVIESAGFKLSLSEPEWRLTAVEEQAQREANQQAILQFLQKLVSLKTREDATGA